MPRKARGPNGETLPPGLYWDGKYFRIRPLPGYPRERAGKHKGRALQLLKQRRAAIQSGTARTNRQLRANTLDALAGLWKRDKADKDMRSLERAYGQYQQHISPRLGKREPDSVRPREVLAVLWDAYERDEGKRRALGKLGAKSVHNLKATLSSIYSFGVFEELVEMNVCRAVPKDKLPKRGKPRRKVYTDVEAPLLMNHVRDDQPEWRIFYCLQGLAGMRPGAAAGRRWSDLDWNTPVLPSLRVWSKYQDLPLKTSKGDDTKERTVPVHPDLGRVLRRWKLHGFAQRYGRPPRPDDFICPDARTMQALTPGRTSKAPDTDCPAVGIPDKGNHALRRYFITYARRGGARKDMLERVTHNASGDILDVYTDPDGIWPALCEAVLCLNVEWPRDNVVQLPLAASVGWDKLTDKLGHETEKRSEGDGLLAPAVGLEPTTKRLTVARSTN